MSMMGELKFFLGFQLRQLAKGTFISQEKYVRDMVKKFDMAKASPMKTPMPIKGQLGSCDGEKDVDQKEQFTHGDIAFCYPPEPIHALPTISGMYYSYLVLAKIFRESLISKSGDSSECRAYHINLMHYCRPENIRMIDGCDFLYCELRRSVRNRMTPNYAHLALNQETRRRQNEFMAARNHSVPPDGPEVEPVVAPTWEMPPIDDEMLQNFDLSLFAHGGATPPRTRSAPAPDAAGYGDDDKDNEEYDEDDDEDGDEDSPPTGT
ncbi:hypothetical protein QYE76_005708 [Lolium multiflorum]|uniref:Reverse transcriptase Ty1/copia-type domain-containing protein n=1 Tax=Lolium multiflorum TaxID=4521 RepID=A0AAD8RT91_LOLMU|nr:hypothetical protein QYE76_005708 [Lolium multiflorum]